MLNRDDSPVPSFSRIDRYFQAPLGRWLGGLSPLSMSQALTDWAVHFAASPGKQAELFVKAQRGVLGSFARALRKDSDGEAKQDRRFSSPAWRRPPFNLLYRWQLLCEEGVDTATKGVHGVSRQHERIVNALMRQWVEMCSPSNLPWTNPDIIRELIRTRGRSLVSGMRNAVEDASRSALGKRPAGADQFAVGENVAVTPGKVVFRNELIELIQYAPTTEKVHAEPVLIVPAWIMKYYILDLSPENSLVRYLVGRGHTVFMISWRNPGRKERDLGLEDYLRLGVGAALDAVGEVVPGRQAHGVGYCLGGTLLSIAAAAMARDDDRRLKTLTLLAAQTDFTEAGEIRLFIDDNQVASLENYMRSRGYLHGNQMAGAFRILRSNDLIWSRIIREYWMGQRQSWNDLMAWNADVTRMPYRMHAEYLRQLYLDNDLVQGRFKVRGRPVALSDIRIPIFVVGTESDHVAPWRSVYKFHLWTGAELTFLLTSGGHNAGIVSEPGHPRRHYRVSRRGQDGRYEDPESWLARVSPKEGSWWPEWREWLAARSSGLIDPPALGSGEDAPGIYVREQ